MSEMVAKVVIDALKTDLKRVQSTPLTFVRRSTDVMTTHAQRVTELQRQRDVEDAQSRLDHYVETGLLDTDRRRCDHRDRGREVFPPI